MSEDTTYLTAAEQEHFDALKRECGANVDEKYSRFSIGDIVLRSEPGKPDFRGRVLGVDPESEFVWLKMLDVDSGVSPTTVHEYHCMHVKTSH